MGRVVNANPRSVFPRERAGTPYIGSLMGAGADLDGCRISHLPPRFHHRTVQPVAIRRTDWSIPSQRRLNIIVKNNRIFISPTQIIFPIKYEYMGYRFRINWLVHHRAFYTRKTAGKFNNMVTKLYWFGVVCGFPHYNECTYVAILTVTVHSIGVGYREFNTVRYEWKLETILMGTATKRVMFIRRLTWGLTYLIKSQLILRWHNRTQNTHFLR